MSRLGLLETFCTLAECGHFGEAARKLGIEKSTVSRHLALLEEHCGVPLVRRTTRKIALTEEGKSLLEHVRGPIRDLRSWDPLEAFHHGAKGPKAGKSGDLLILRGRLKITAPVALGDVLLCTPVASFRKKHPDVEVILDFSDQVVDLIGQGFDLAIRSGSLEGNSLRAVTLGSERFALYASPHLIRRYPELFDHSNSGIGFDELRARVQKLPCIEYRPDGGDFAWEVQPLEGGGKTRRLMLQRPTLANSLNFVRKLCIAGGGVAFLPEFICRDDVENGSLKHVFQSWASIATRFSAVFPGHRIRSPLIDAFIDEVRKSLGR